MLHRPLLILALLLLPALGAAQTEDSPTETQPALGAPVESGGMARESWRVATRQAPPFAFIGPDGDWTGIAIEMFRAIADELDRDYTLTEVALDEMIDGVAEGRFDAAVSALSITPARETRVDFTFPYYSTGLGIAIDPTVSGGWLRVARNFFSWEFLAVIVGLGSVLLAAGAAVWVFERRGNNEEFRRDAARGLGDGFWWAAVTMTTVGYGDKSPRTPGGRIVGLIWMFTAMLIVASFTAAIAASLTVGQLGTAVRSADDLSQIRTGVVAGTSGAEELAGRGINAQGFDTVAAGYDALLAGEIGAFVHDRPLLQWVALQDYQGRIRVLDEPIGRQDYAVALPEGAADREAVNRALLAYIRSDAWGRLVESYLGAGYR